MCDKKNKEEKEKIIKFMLKNMLKCVIKILKLVHKCSQIFIALILVFM